MRQIAEHIVTLLVGGAAVIVVAAFSGWLGIPRDFVLGVTAGVISSVLIAVFLGIVRSPDLAIELGDTADGSYAPGQFRFVHVRVRNSAYRLWRWQLRRPATFCRAKLSFGDIGVAAHRFELHGRWSSLAEPVHVVPGAGPILDYGAILVPPREIISAGEQAPVPIAVKQEGVTDCFGFNNESYLHPNWSNPAWVLGPGTYWVRVQITSAEVEAVRVFYVVNNGTLRAGLTLQNVP